MKKKYYILVAIAMLALVVTPNLTRAEDAEVNVDVQASVSPRPSGTPSATIRDRLRAELETKNRNAQLNQTNRNTMLGQRMMGSSTMATGTRMMDGKNFRADMRASTSMMRADIRDDRREDVGDARKECLDAREGATTTEDRKEGKEVCHHVRFDIFQIRKDALVKQLNLSISNLKQIRTRIDSRIQKAEQSGTNMTEAKKLLATADLKITAAQVSVDALTKITATSTGASVSASTTVGVSLDKPRLVGAAAIKAVMDARQALNLVVRAIAHNMGLGDGHSTTTPPIIPVPTPGAAATTTTTTSI